MGTSAPTSQVKHTMRLPENLKEILNKAKEAGEEEVKNLVEEEEKREVVQLNDEEEEEEDLHSLPAGVWPKQGPRPGVIGTLLYYISLALTFIGLLVLLRCAYIQDSLRPPVLLVGLSLTIAGLLFLNISNFFYNREQQNLVEYLQGKISEMNAERTRLHQLI